MNISFRFFDKESWSIYGVHKTFLILMFFILLKVNLTPTILIFMSLLAMMEGQLFDKIIFTGFLNLLVYRGSYEWIYESILFVISIIAIHFVHQNNMFQHMFEKSILLLWVNRIASFLWMSYILYKIIYLFIK